MEVLKKHKSRFGQDFSSNKKALDQVAVIRSKGLKNEIAGYITKHIKHEINDKKLKQEGIESEKIVADAKYGGATGESEEIKGEPVASEIKGEPVAAKDPANDPTAYKKPEPTASV